MSQDLKGFIWYHVLIVFIGCTIKTVHAVFTMRDFFHWGYNSHTMLGFSFGLAVMIGSGLYLYNEYAGKHHDHTHS